MTIALKTASEIAAKAAELVGGEREAQHGNKTHNFANIATMWNAYLDIRPDYDAPLDATDVGHLMAAMKLARTQLGSLNIDDYVDGAGYFACAGEVAVAAETGIDRRSNPFWNNYVNGKQTDQTPKFKVGDRVRHVRQPTHVLTIERIDNERVHGTCTCGVKNGFRLTDIELVPA